MKDLFQIPQSQRKPALIFTAILLILLILRMSLVYFIRPDKDFMVLDHIPIGISADTIFNKDSNVTSPDSLFFFDPNTVTEEQLRCMGISPRTAQTWIKFRIKGFVFRTPEDISKIYGMKKHILQRLLPFVRIKNTIKETQNFKKSNTHNDSTKLISPASIRGSEKININSADSVLLEKLPGIGPVLSHRILKYRSMLGGYISVNQVREVYGIKPETYEIIKKWIYVQNEFQPNKIYVNRDEFKTINRHPYVPYDLTKKIIQFRKNALITPENFYWIVDNDTLYRRILPYLDFSK